MKQVIFSLAVGGAIFALIYWLSVIAKADQWTGFSTAFILGIAFVVSISLKKDRQ